MSQTSTTALEQKPPRTARAILCGTLAVGILDITDAIVFFGLTRGVRPMRIFQSIAAGLLGRSAFSGGIPTAVLGGLLHFFIAFAVVATYYFASKRFEELRRRAVLCGLLYGVVVYFFMNRVVVPLSAASQLPFSWPVFFNGVMIHAFGVGLPSAFAARFGQGK